jgi:hypothetical protein
MIKFFRGLKAAYVEATHSAGIYFATDTGEILHGGKSYSGLLEVGKSVEDISLVNGVMTITYTDASTTEIEVGSGKYKSNIEDKTIAMTTQYGDFVSGTTVGALEGKTYDELFDGILFPSVNPTKNGDPSVSGFALTASGPVELGTSVISISEAGLNKNTWKTYNNNAAYAGDVTSTTYVFTINGTAYDEISDLENLTYTTVGNHTYKATVNYEKGINPVNNKGVEVPSLACPAGSKSSTRTVNVTAPWYASTATAGTLTKQALIAWNTTAGAMQAGADGTGFEVKPHTAAAPQMFKLPRKASNLQMYSTVSKSFETVALSDWTEVSASESVNGVNHTYYTYTYKGADRGSVKLIVKF